mmetsp:Transcript_18629/g.47745  ORF Transcript_18629/g.47745 Transcript_18629/m.47745 type:complete len:424 (-) Transcript_18629:164-1435(-)
MSTPIRQRGRAGPYRRLEVAALCLLVALGAGVTRVAGQQGSPAARSRASRSWRELQPTGEGPLPSASRRAAAWNRSLSPRMPDSRPVAKGSSVYEIVAAVPDTGFRPLAARESCRRALLATPFAENDPARPDFNELTLQPLRLWGQLSEHTPWMLPAHVLAANPFYVADPSLSSIKGYRRCALVGSAGVLKGSRWGRAIDNPREYDAIIRLNNAPTQGFEADVGARTTVRFIQDWHLSAKNLPMLKNTQPAGFAMVWPSPTRPGLGSQRGRFGGPSAGERDKVSAAQNELERARPNITMTRISDLVYHTSAIIGQQLNGRFPPHVPSSGWYGILMSLNICSSLDIIGYSWGSAAETLQRRMGHTGDRQTAGTAYYFDKHANGRKDEAAYYRSRFERNPKSFHNLGNENAALRGLAEQCGFAIR